LLYRMRIQADIVSRLTQRMEESQERLRQVKNAQAQNAARIKTIEDTIDQTQDANTRKSFEDELSSRKAQVERLSTQQQELETREGELSSQLRLEQSKLDDMQASLDQIQRNLENLANQTDSRPNSSGFPPGGLLDPASPERRAPPGLFLDPLSPPPVSALQRVQLVSNQKPPHPRHFLRIHRRRSARDHVHLLI